MAAPAQSETPDGKQLILESAFHLVQESDTTQESNRVILEPCSHLVPESPDSNSRVIRDCCTLVQTRLGKHERRLLLLGNTETWTPIPGWRVEGKTNRKHLSGITRPCTRLEKLKLIERRRESGYGWDAELQRPRPRDDSNSIECVRCDKNGYESTYRIWVDTHTFRLTTLGAAVVDQFRDELISGKCIRWSRFAPPPLPLEPRA